MSSLGKEGTLVVYRWRTYLYSSFFCQIWHRWISKKL